MKIRYSFVTNSSSSSFIISKDDLTAKQYQMLKGYNEYASTKKWHDCWYITEDEDSIRCFTVMDNGEMDEFLKRIKVDLKVLKYEE